MRIRYATPEDLPAIREIYAPYVTDTPFSFEYTVPSPEEFAERYRGIAERFPWIVCEADGAVAGYAYASPAFSRAAYQWDCDLTVYVHPAYRRRGVASALYRCLESLLALQGYYNAYAIVTGANRVSMAFHRALGYTQVAALPRCGYKLGRWIDVFWLYKELLPPGGEPTPPVPCAALDPDTVCACFLRFQNELG